MTRGREGREGREGGQEQERKIPPTLESSHSEKQLGSVLLPIALLNIYLPCGEPLAWELVSLYGKRRSLWSQSLAQVHWWPLE